MLRQRNIFGALSPTPDPEDIHALLEPILEKEAVIHYERGFDAGKCKGFLCGACMASISIAILLSTVAQCTLH
jgi:hypothetical protein